MTQPTDRVIEQLGREAQAVEPLATPWRRTARWIGLSLPYLALIVLIWPGQQRFAYATDVRFAIEQAAALLTGATAAFAAFATTVPGHSRRVILFPAVALGVWMLVVGQGCASDIVEHGAAGWHVGIHWPCLVATVIIGAVPSAGIALMLRQGAPLTPRLTAVLAGIAAGGLANVAVRFVHASDTSVIVLVWHVGAVAAAVGVAAAGGRQMFNWPSSLRRSRA
jgi:hypothetical protein